MIEQLEISIVIVARLKNHLEDSLEHFQQQNHTMILDYKNSLNVLFGCLQPLGCEWKHYQNTEWKHYQDQDTPGYLQEASYNHYPDF